MASKNQVRGALLEEIVLFLLLRAGYRRVLPTEDGVRNGRAGLEVEGRGSRHQIDALVAPLHSHPFVYPIRLMVEAKCESGPIGLNTARSVVGAISDINQNYFASRAGGQEIRVQRFNYHAAIFASDGYSANAERYALAHQVFLIDYSHVAIMRPIVDALLALDLDDFIGQPRQRVTLSRIRAAFREFLDVQELPGDDEVFSARGAAKIRATLLPALRQLRGSYYGMIEGIYPVHLVSRAEIPAQFIALRADIPCEIRVSNDGQNWAFEPSGIARNEPGFFSLEFTIPEFVADMLKARADQDGEGMPQWRQFVDIKRQHMRFVDVSAVQDGRVIGFRLTLDFDWLDRYVRTREDSTRRPL